MKPECIFCKLKPMLFYVILFLFILAYCTVASNYDLDLWAKLIIGSFFIHKGHVPTHDFLSYTPTHLWVDHEWGSGVVFYLINHFFSVAGFVILQSILLFLLFFMITKIIKLRGVKTTTPYNFLFYYFAFSSFNYVIDQPIRCQLFTFLFFTVFLYILELARIGKFKPLVFMPIIMVFWCNLHGGCTAGFGLIVLYIIGELFSGKSLKSIKPYAFALLACSVAFLINPWGFGFIKRLFYESFVSRTCIGEWAALFSKTFNIKFKLFMSVLLLFEAVAISRQMFAKTFKLDLTKFLVLAATLYLAVMHIKFIPFAIISMSCFIYDDFYDVFNFITRNLFDKIANIKETIVYAFILIFAFSSIYINGFGPYANWDRYPLKAVEFIKINNIKGNLLQSLTFGSYISYKLYPQNKIFMDGRFVGVYDETLLTTYDYFQSGCNGWSELLDLYPTDAMLLEKALPVIPLLKKDNNWKAVYEDNGFIVFVKNTDVAKKYKQPSNDINYYKKTLFDTNIRFKNKSIEKR